MFKKFSLLFFLILFYSNLNAEIVDKIIIEGNKRVSEETIKIYGACRGMGNRRYKIPQKSSFPQQRKYTCSKMWRGNNEKYDLKTLKL